MVPVYDFITGQVIYVNPLQCVYATKDNKNDSGTHSLYDVYLTTFSLIRINYEDFTKIKRLGVN